MSYLKSYVTDPWFHFRRSTLNPVLTDIVAKTTTALKTDGVVNRVEQLLSVGREANERLTSVAKREDMHGFVGVAAFAAGAALFLLSPVSLTAVGLGLFLAGFGVVTKCTANYSRALLDRQVVAAKINSEVLSLAERSPEEVARSPSFVKALADGFNTKAANRSYEDLVASISPGSVAPAQASKP